MKLFKGESGTSTAIQLQRNGTLKEHSTRTPALLLCISGILAYEDENETETTLEPGDYVMIIPGIKHWIYTTIPSQLLLLK